MKRKITALALCLLMLVQMFPVTALAAVDSGNCGPSGSETSVTWTLADDGTLTISGSGTTADWDNSGSNNAPWIDSASQITKVVIESGVTGIGAYAFSGVPMLNAVDLPASLTTIGNSAFSGSAVTAITFGGTTSEWQTLITNYCGSGTGNEILATIDATCSDGSYSPAMTSMGSGVCGAAGNESGVTWSLDMTGNLTISGSGDMADYTGSDTVPWASYLGQINMVTVEDGITHIGDFAFADCTLLNMIQVTTTGTLTIGASAFKNCSMLNGVTFMDGLTSIGASAFENCTTLNSPSFPESMTTVGASAFAGCTALTNAAYGGTKAQWTALKSSGIDNTGNGNAPLLNADVQCSDGEIASIIASGNCGAEDSPSSVTWELTGSGTLIISGTGAMADYTSTTFPWYENRTSIQTVTIEGGVTSIGNSAFSSCSSLTSVTIADSVTSIGVTIQSSIR